MQTSVFALLISLTILPLVNSYYIADSCGTNEEKADITQAVREAVNVAKYAEWRANSGLPINEDPSKANIVSELLGTSAQAVHRFVGKYIIAS